MRRIGRYIKIGFLILLSMTPVFWFFHRPGILIDGVDTNFPLDPSLWFHRRFFTWTAVSNAGADFSASAAGTFFHLLQFVPFKLGLSLQIVELFSLLFWFFLIIFSSWFLARMFFPEKSFPQIIFVILYCLNIWFFNSWENVKVANLSLGAAIPLGVCLLFLLRERKIKRSTASLVSILVGIILAGAGINPAYIVCFFGVLTIFLFSEIFLDFRNIELVFERLKDFVLVAVFIILVNAFWILPSLNFIFGSITASNSIGALGFTNWVDSLSQNTSFVNVLRMQGAWDWYIFDSATGLPQYIPYALKYFNNPFFIGFSFLIPSFAFLAYFVHRKKYNLLYVFFGVMLVIGIFLTAGTHPPSGGLFGFFARHIPFFSLFRSPWYIFAPLVGLSIAGLVAIFFDNIYNLSLRKIIHVVEIVFIAGSLIYFYPILLGKIFRPASTNGFYIKFPDYVYQTRDFLSLGNMPGRILSYPDDNIERFNWGYSGTDSILNLLSDKETIFSPLNDINSPLSKVLGVLYSSLKRGELAKVGNLAGALSITQVFDKRDQVSLSPVLPSKILSNKIVGFGPWAFYGLSGTTGFKIKAVSSPVLGYPYEDSSEYMSLIAKDEVLVNPSDSVISNTNLFKNSGSILFANNSQLSDLNLLGSLSSNFKAELFLRDLGSVEYTFDVPRAGVYSPILENYGIETFDISNGNAVRVLMDGKNDVWNIAHSDDSYLYFNPLNLDKGSHKVTIQLKNKNLVNSSNFSQKGNGVFGFSNGVFSISNVNASDTSLSFPVSEFDPFGYYLVDLSYSKINGSNARVVIDQRINDSPIVSDTENIPSYPGWQDFSFYYRPVETFSTMNVDLVASQTMDPLGTKVQYENLAVYKVFNNELFFKMESTPARVLAKVEVTQDSPVQYSGRAIGGSGPQILVFNENYSPGWRLSVIGNPKAKISHFTGNYYANAWYVDGVGSNFDFVIYYEPQNLLKIGYVIACGSILVSLAYFSFGTIKKRNGRKTK